MAPRKSAAQKAAEAAAEPQSAPETPVLTLVRSNGVKREARGIKVPPEVADAVAATLDEGPLAFVVSTKDAAEHVQKLVRKTAREQDLSVSVSVSENEDGTWVCDFKASRDKRKRNYDAADVRAWAVAEGYDPQSYVKKISAEVRHAFRVAHGYESLEAVDAAE